MKILGGKANCILGNTKDADYFLLPWSSLVCLHQATTPTGVEVPLASRAQLFEGRLGFNPGFFFLCSKAFSQIIFSVIFRASNHQLVDKKNSNEMLFKLSNLNSNLALTLRYLYSALNNSAQVPNICV